MIKWGNTRVRYTPLILLARRSATAGAPRRTRPTAIKKQGFMPPQVGNSWRTTADISPSWDSILRCLDNNIGLARFAGPGAWNDPDMLEVCYCQVDLTMRLTTQENTETVSAWRISWGLACETTRRRYRGATALTVWHMDFTRYF